MDVEEGSELYRTRRKVSWDAYILKFKEGPPPGFRFADIEAEPSRRELLGSPEEVMSAISRALPAIQWHGVYGGYETPHFQIGIDLAGEGPLSKIWVNTNALKTDEPSNPVSVLAQICKANGWSLMDCSTSKFIDLNRPSIEGWQMYVDLMRLVIAELTTGKPERRRTKKAKSAKKKGKTNKRRRKK